MKLSIVTPSFNQGVFLEDCLGSVKEGASRLMSLDPAEPVSVEHIVVDACSTDGTLKILEEWKQSTARLPFGNYSLNYTSEPDRGQTDAINKGFRKTSGDWVMWLNADDYLMPGALEKMLLFAGRHPGADVIYGDCIFVDEKGNKIREKLEGPFDFGMLLFYGCYIPSTAAFYNRRVLERGLYLDASYKVCMDYEYYMRLATEGCRFLHLAEPLACFRWHGSNVSTLHGDIRGRERLKVQRWVLARMGLSWVGRGWILALLHRLYQAKRVFARVIGKILGCGPYGEEVRPFTSQASSSVS